MQLATIKLVLLILLLTFVTPTALAGEDGQFMRYSDAWYTVQHLP